jgi:hypothetical protein
VAYNPCGYAVEMLRSCYDTAARFYEGEIATDPISWYFCESNAPFLPVPSCINSLNWVDAKERVDTGHAGEVPGFPRPYSKGERNIAFNHSAYCGTPTDWLGLGVRPADPDETAFGVPRCCNPDDIDPVDVSTYLQVDNVTSNLTPPGFGGSVRASELPFDFFQWWPFDDGGPFMCSIDLYNAIPNPSGTMDNLTDFYLCDFPGYGVQRWLAGTIDEWPPGSGQMSVKTTCLYTCTAAPGVSVNQANGYVVSDNNGFVLWYQPFGGFVFGSAGDYLQFDVHAVMGFDYT